jgi:hypothetical protein
MQQIYDTIDRQKFQWVVVFVAGVGFFLDGYTVRAFPKLWPTIIDHPSSLPAISPFP